MDQAWDQVRAAAQNATSMASDALAFIELYTGLPPIVFFTVLALVVGAYYLITGIVAPSQIPASGEDGTAAAAAPAHLGDLTKAQLAEYDGSDSAKPLLVSIKAQVYDVTTSRDFYGPGGPYSAFAGKDASRALAKMSFNSSDMCGSLEGLTDEELEVLKDWELKFLSKYPKVGSLVVAVNDQAAKRREEQDSQKQAEYSSTADELDDEVRRELQPEQKQEHAQESEAGKAHSKQQEDLVEHASVDEEAVKQRDVPELDERQGVRAKPVKDPVTASASTDQQEDVKQPGTEAKQRETKEPASEHDTKEPSEHAAGEDAKPEVSQLESSAEAAKPEATAEGFEIIDKAAKTSPAADTVLTSRETNYIRGLTDVSSLSADI